MYLESFRSPGFRFSYLFLVSFYHSFFLFLFSLLGLSFLCISVFLYFWLATCFAFSFLAVGVACFFSMFLSLFSSLILSLRVYASVTVAPFFRVFFSAVPFSR